MSVAWRLLLLALISPILYVVSAVAWFPAAGWHAFVAPRASALMGYRVAEAAANGVELHPRHEWVPLERMPVPLLHAVLAAEDTRFYEHRGFDLEQIEAAWRARRSGARLRGASTISQQTAKNLYLDPSRSPLRKAREVILTGALELFQSKDRILEEYLNVVELGPGIFGTGAAARAFFDREPDAMTREQSALLAATLPAPLARNPAASTPALRARQRMILGRMGRWYEGPSIAEEEALAREDEPEQPEPPRELPSEPLELELEETADSVPAIEAAAPLDGEEPTSEDPPPVEAPPGSAADPSGSEP
jgi:monofunctional biosynthetic peptidoglycan transglycosylase